MQSAPPRRHAGAADRGGAVRRRPLRHRGDRSPAAAGAESDNSGAFLRGEVELLPDTDEPEAVAEAERALSTFETYRHQLSELRGGPVLAGEMPSDPAYLSYALASTCLLTLPQRQALLEADSAATRLGMLRRTLHEEMRAMRALPSLPATEVARTRWSPN